MEAAAHVTIPANENVPSVRLALCITDPDVAQELEKHDAGPDRDAFAEHALRIGVLALRQASGALDAQAIQREGERMLAAVRDVLHVHTSQTTSSIAQLFGGYLDPATGSLPQRLERLTKRDGEIEALLGKHLDGDRSTMARTLAEALRVQRDTILREFSRDRPDSAVSRLLGEITKANGTLGKELTDVVSAFAESNARFQTDVRATLEGLRVRREEAARSSQHGHTFEYAAGELLQMEAQHAGDVCERLSGTPGREGRKTGDYVVTLGPESGAPGARIAIECKAEKGYTEAEALEELGLARKNREARAGVFVVARESAKEGFATFRRVGADVLVIWDANDPGTDVYLKAAVSVARALVVEQHRRSDQTETDVREIEQSVRAIERLVTTVESIAHDARNIVKKGTKIGKAAEGVKERLVEEVERLKGVVSTGLRAALA